MQCQAHCELQEAFIDYIEYKDDKVVTPMPRSMKEFFIRSCPAPSFHRPTLKLPKLRILPQVPGCFRILTGFRVQAQKTCMGWTWDLRPGAVQPSRAQLSCEHHPGAHAGGGGELRAFHEAVAKLHGKEAVLRTYLYGLMVYEVAG